MVVTVKNVALEKYFEKYHIQNLNELDDDQLLELCRSMGVPESWLMDKEIKNRRLGLDRTTVLNAIEGSVTYDDYMGSIDWDIEHDKLDLKYNIRGRLPSHESGGQTFKEMENAGLGFYRLKPRETRKLNISQRWLEDIFLKSPATTPDKNGEYRVEVIDEGGKILNKVPEKPVVTELKAEEVKEVRLEDMDYKLLQKLAKGFKLNPNRKKPILVEMIKERQKLIK